jgi:hypothetical protein
MRKVIFAILAACALAWSSAAWAVLQSTTSTPDRGQPIPGATIKLLGVTPPAPVVLPGDVPKGEEVK